MKIIRYCGSLFAMGAIVLLVMEFKDSFQNVQLSLDIYLAGILVVTIILGVSVYVILAFGWVIQVSGDHYRFSLRDSFVCIGLSQVGKYLPGNFAHYLGRGLLARKHLSGRDISATLIIESISLAAASTAVGLLYFLYFDVEKFISLQTLMLLCVLTIIVSAYSYTKLKSVFSLIHISFETVTVVFFLHLLITGINGVGIYLLASVFYDAPDLSLLQYMSGYAISFLIGFIVPGAPGGIGVREYVFVVLFGDFIGAQTALELILLVRLVSVINDTLLFVLAYSIRRFGNYAET